MSIQELLRRNIRDLHAYSSARDEFKGEASVFLDANENPYNAPFNRYPDPLQWDLKKKISLLKNIPAENIFLGNGSDEPIDLLYRAFCEPRTDNVVAIEPTYGMYKVCADINDVEYRKVLLNADFQFSADDVLEKTDEHTKILWLCSPNNPTGNLLERSEIQKILETFEGISLIDEAYIDFAQNASFLPELLNHPRLIVLQTFSKAWASAGIRLGMAFASEEIIRVFNKIKYPYNINILTQKKALELLENVAEVNNWVEILLFERKKMQTELMNLSIVQKIYPTDANFILVKVPDANKIYHNLTEKGIIIRNRNNVSLCTDCLRITIGTAEENAILLNALKNF